MTEKLYSQDIVPIGGSSTHVVLEFPYESNQNSYIYMGSLISISYSVYRDKSPVFNLGANTVDGFAIGNKYVAGSMVMTMFLDDEISSFIKSILNIENQVLATSRNTEVASGVPNATHTYMKDDLTSFNIHIIFASEYHGQSSKVTVYGANFINNGQVMSVDDIVTESTASFVAKDIREQHRIGEIIQPASTSPTVVTGSHIINRLTR